MCSRFYCLILTIVTDLKRRIVHTEEFYLHNHDSCLMMSKIDMASFGHFTGKKKQPVACDFSGGSNNGTDTDIIDR